MAKARRTKPRWQIVLMPKKGQTIGYVEAATEASAIRAAIKAFNVTEEEQRRLVARRERPGARTVP
jgi:hypothetical protein